jgi:hypothetical protein
VTNLAKAITAAAAAATDVKMGSAAVAAGQACVCRRIGKSSSGVHVAAAADDASGGASFNAQV